MGSVYKAPRPEGLQVINFQRGLLVVWSEKTQLIDISIHKLSSSRISIQFILKTSGLGKGVLMKMFDYLLAKTYNTEYLLSFLLQRNHKTRAVFALR